MDKNLEKLKYETGEHHRQNLRSQINQDMIDKLEISNNPSSNYHHAYKSLYYDELKKSEDLKNTKINLENYKNSYNRMIENEQNRFGRGISLNNSMTASQLHNLNYRDVDYQDYDVLKETRALDHTLKNYDGGKKFYEANDQQLMKQMAEMENLRTTLTQQLSAKQERRINQKLQHQEEKQSMKQKFKWQRNWDRQMKNQQILKNKEHCQNIKEQMEEDRMKRGKKSLFNFNNVARHNPITNPIEYHIDNPYILKQIQVQGKYRG